MIHIKSPQEIELMRESCRIVKETLEFVGKNIKAGMTTKEVDDRLETDGILYAQLTYSKSIADLLAKWEPVDETMAADFTAIAPADAPTPPVGDWLGYQLMDGDAQLVLLYDPVHYILYVAESQPK